MGKRKMHGYTFYQCDWTGYPMRATNCYMPVWTNDKMTKRGSYCNWESVLAHAEFLHANNETSAAQCARVLEYVYALTGITWDVPATDEKDVPLYSGFGFHHLEHFKDDTAGKDATTSHTLFGNNWDMATYHKVCQAVTCQFELTAVKVSPEGQIYEVILDSKAGKFKFNEFLTKPYMNADYSESTQDTNLQDSMQSFSCTHKPRMSKDRDVCVFYYPYKNGLVLNTAASSLFKMQIYGDVLLVQQTKEACFMPRERYVHFTKQQFDDYFGKKKKKQAEVPALTDVEFKEAREGMVASLSEFEKRATDGAERPGDLVRGAVMPPSTGKELADVARMQLLPPPVIRQPSTGKRAWQATPTIWPKKQRVPDPDEAAPVAMEA
jgi:hypothetical protein